LLSLKRLPRSPRLALSRSRPGDIPRLSFNESIILQEEEEFSLTTKDQRPECGRESYQITIEMLMAGKGSASCTSWVVGNAQTREITINYLQCKHGGFVNEKSLKIHFKSLIRGGIHVQPLALIPFHVVGLFKTCQAVHFSQFSTLLKYSRNFFFFTQNIFKLILDQDQKFEFMFPLKNCEDF
jgi:hypothetical protein